MERVEVGLVVDPRLVHMIEDLLVTNGQHHESIEARGGLVGGGPACRPKAGKGNKEGEVHGGRDTLHGAPLR